MENKRLTKDFFSRPTLRVAQELLGKILVRKIGRKVVKTMITETEAYCGPKDLASHASKGRTKRTEIMFGPPGHAYVYLIYGMYYCLNIVTEAENYPAAVLIRGVSLQWPVDSENSKFRKLKTPKRPVALGALLAVNPGRPLDSGLGCKPRKGQWPSGLYWLETSLNGPGKLCRFLKVDKTLNGEDTIKSRRLWIEDGKELKPAQIGHSRRIGINYAGSYKNKLWRFYVKNRD